MSAAKKIEIPEFEIALNKRILVVEDEPGIAKTYQDILGQKAEADPGQVIKSSRSKKVEQINKEEFELVVVHNADDAIVAIKQSLKKGKPFTMGFFDVLLGEGKDGIELFKEVSELDPYIFGVFVTAYNDRSVDSIQSFLGEDCTSRWDYLNKPFSHGEILQKARNFVSMWNYENQSRAKDEVLSKVQRDLLESERKNSVAALARGVTHEFGNILMQIMGKADLGLKKEAEGMKESLQVILDASIQANNILSQFKDLSGTGGGENPKELLSLPGLLGKTLDLMEHQFRLHNIKVTKVKTEEVSIMANETAILQVLVNTTINAIHAMGDSGQIDYTIIAGQKFAEIQIRDYGPGIKKDLLEKVKQPFFTTKGKKGTGLGLSICNEIIEMEHQGEFIVQNHGVKGLEVVIKLPYSQSEEEL